MMDLKAVEKAYKRYAGVYDFFFGAVFHPGRRMAVEHLHCKQGDRILEVGVGTGLSLPLYPDHVKVVGIDLSEPMLKLAREKVEREELSQVESLQLMNAQEMTFPDNSFDRVVAMYVASVVPDRKEFVREVQRVCRPGGIIIFLNHFASDSGLMEKVETAMTRFSGILGFNPHLSLQEFLKETEFEADQIIPANLFGYWTLVLGENKKPKSSASETLSDSQTM